MRRRRRVDCCLPDNKKSLVNILIGLSEIPLSSAADSSNNVAGGG